jgi:ADP-ribose pyrophosphatase
MTLRRDPRVEILSARTLLAGRIFDVVDETVRLPSGLEQRLQIVDHSGAAAIAALSADGDLLLVRQYRHAAGAWMLEIPAGRLEPGELPLLAAQRELEEEAGYRARRWEVLATFYPAPGFCSELMTLFLATELEPVAGKRPHDADEELEIVRKKPAELLAGEVIDAKTLIAAMLLRERGA